MMREPDERPEYRRYLDYMMTQLVQSKILASRLKGRLTSGCSEVEGPGIEAPYFYLSVVRTIRLLWLIPIRREERMVFAIHAGHFENEPGRRWVKAVVYQPFSAYVEDILQMKVDEFARYFNATHVSFERTFP